MKKIAFYSIIYGAFSSLFSTAWAYTWVDPDGTFYGANSSVMTSSLSIGRAARLPTVNKPDVATAPVCSGAFSFPNKFSGLKPLITEGIFYEYFYLSGPFVSSAQGTEFEVRND